MGTISREEFQTLLKPVAGFIADKVLDSNLQNELNESFPQGGEVLDGIKQACHDAIAAGRQRRDDELGRNYVLLGLPIVDAQLVDPIGVDVAGQDDRVGDLAIFEEAHDRHALADVARPLIHRELIAALA